jgi:hypothetical protein
MFIKHVRKRNQPQKTESQAQVSGGETPSRSRPGPRGVPCSFASAIRLYPLLFLSSRSREHQHPLYAEIFGLQASFLLIGPTLHAHARCHGPREERVLKHIYISSETVKLYILQTYTSTPHATHDGHVHVSMAGFTYAPI